MTIKLSDKVQALVSEFTSVDKLVAQLQAGESVELGGSTLNAITVADTMYIYTGKH